MKRFFISTIFALCSIILFAQNNPKNIIVVLAHGVGYNHVKAHELYKGSSSPLSYAGYPVQYGATNYPSYWAALTEAKDPTLYKGDYHSRRVWQEFDYANTMPTCPTTAGSSIATGVKSAYQAVSVDLDSTQIETFLELAADKGKVTGVITNLALSKSAVASFSAHAPTNHNPADIFNQLLGSKLSLMIGAGNPLYNNEGNLQTEADYTYIHEADWDSLKLQATKFANGTLTQGSNWELIEDYNSLLQAANGTRIAGVLQYKDAFYAPHAQSNRPDLAEITNKALKNLSDNNQGLVLIVETGAIEDASIRNNKEDMIASMDELDQTIKRINQWIDANSSWDETLVIVAGTYESGFLTGTDFDKHAGTPDYLTKNIAITQGNAGAMPSMEFQSTNSTKHITPVFAKGQGSKLFHNYADEEDFVYGKHINNTEIGQICKYLLEENPYPAPKNIIFMINDGVGYNHIKAANYYQGRTEQYQDFPVQLFHATYPNSTNENVTLGSMNNSYESALAWTEKGYLHNRTNGTCSGASGTAMATGVKTYYYSIGVDMHHNALNSIAKYAHTLGKSKGVVSSVPAYDATPASFLANNIMRTTYHEIIRQMAIESNAEVIIGGGHPDYDHSGNLKSSPNYKDMGGQEFWEDMKAGKTTFRTPTNSGWTTVQDIDGDGNPDAWTFIEDSADFAKYAYGPTPQRIFGVPKIENTLQAKRDGIDYQEVHFDDRNTGVPELWQLARVGLQTLNKNQNGFFIMIEGDAADLASHSNHKGRMIEEMIAFNTAVDTVIAWIEQNGGWEKNLLIVSSDHETGYITHPDFAADSSMLTNYDIIDNGAGKVPGMIFNGGHHSNQLVPFFAKGVGSEIFETYADEYDYKRGKFLSNSEIGQAMFTLWGGEPCTIINNVLTINKAAQDVILYTGIDTTFTLDSNIISDEEDTEFNISVSTKPKWLNHTPNTFTFSGTPEKPISTRAKLSVSDGATTGAGIIVEYTFRIIVQDKDNLSTTTNDDITTFPIPAQKQLTITNLHKGDKISIFNTVGKEIYTIIAKNNKVEVLDINTLDPGIYQLRINQDSQIIIKTILIE